MYISGFPFKDRLVWSKFNLGNDFNCYSFIQIDSITADGAFIVRPTVFIADVLDCEFPLLGEKRSSLINLLSRNQYISP